LIARSTRRSLAGTLQQLRARSVRVARRRKRGGRAYSFTSNA
jgi:hypothetical protein